MKLIEIYVQMDFNNINNPILYIALLRERDSIKFTNIPQESIQHPMLGYIGYLPQSMAQFIYGILPAEQILWPDIRIQTDYGLSGYYSRSYKIIARFAQIAACDTAMYRRGTYYRNLHQPVKRLHERGFCLPYFG